MAGQQPQSGYGSHYSGQPSVPLEMANLQPQRGYESHASGQPSVPPGMVGQQPQRGFGSHYSGQPNVSNVGQGQPCDEHARACSYVQEQLRGQIGDQRPAWDGPVPGFWDRVDQGTHQTRAGNQQTQLATTTFGQGQPMNETPRAQYHAQEQFRASQQGGHRANLGVPATGMQQMSENYGHQHTRSPTLSINVGHGQPATYTQGQNQHSYTPSQSGAQVHSSRTNRGGNGMNGHNSHQNGGRAPYQ